MFDDYMEDSFLLQIKIKIEISNVYSSERNLKGNKEMAILPKIILFFLLFLDVGLEVC